MCIRDSSLYTISHFSVDGKLLNKLDNRKLNYDLIREAIVIWSGDQSSSPMNIIDRICDDIGIEDYRIFFMPWPIHNDPIDSNRMFTTAFGFHSEQEDTGFYSKSFGNEGDKAWKLLNLPAYRKYDDDSYIYPDLFENN